MDPDSPVAADPQPSIIRWILGFLMVGACWGLTTPFMRKAAMNYTPPTHPALTDPKNSALKRKALGIWYAVKGVLSRPAYAIPLLLNVTGSVWFFILIGKAGGYRMNLCPLSKLIDSRAESYCTNHKLASIHVHGAGRMVGRKEGHQ